MDVLDWYLSGVKIITITLSSQCICEHM